MKNILWILPSFLTSISLMSGFLSLMYVSVNNFKSAAWLIIFSIFMDALDGKVARMTKRVTKFGEQYDSIADIVAFGVAPANLIYNLMIFNNINPIISFSAAFLVVLTGALRLARFNITEDKKTAFQGMPIPGGAGIIASYVLFCSKYGIDFKNGILIFLAIVVSMLMISNLPYPSGKQKKAGRANRKLIFLSIIALALITRYHIEFFAFMGMFYLCYGPVKFIIIKLRREINES